MRRLLFAIFGLLVISAVVQTNPVSAQQMMLVYHGKNTIESPTQFAGITMHFLINNDKATVIDAGQNGLEVIRMSIHPNDVCVKDPTTLCFDGEVTNVKNPQHHQVGDKISFTLDFANKKQTATANSGKMQGMTIVMNIDRMNIKSDSPYTMSISREGGFAALPPKTITFDSSNGILILSDRGAITNSTLNSTQIQQINGLVHKASLLNITPQEYSPHPGAADYFTYHLTLNQGIFHKEFTWTDASDAPKSLSEITQSLMYFAQPDK